MRGLGSSGGWAAGTSAVTVSVGMAEQAAVQCGVTAAFSEVGLLGEAWIGGKEGERGNKRVGKEGSRQPWFIVFILFIAINS